MVSDYISREMAKAFFTPQKGVTFLTPIPVTVESLLATIDNIPAADVRPVVWGEWERMSDNDVFGDINCKCSACGKDWWQGPGWFRNARFCPNCGAMMEES